MWSSLGLRMMDVRRKKWETLREEEAALAMGSPSATPPTNVVDSFSSTSPFSSSSSSFPSYSSST